MIEQICASPHGTIPYLEGGKGQTLLFLHGAFATPHAYLPLLDLFSRSFHVVAPTHPGHGDSFKISPTWLYADYIETYREFLKNLDLMPDIIVGHSFGGAFSLSLSRFFTNSDIVVMDSAGLPFPFIVKDFLSALIKESEKAIKHDPNLQTVKELGGAVRSLAKSFGKHPENIPWFYRYGPTLDLSAELKTLMRPIGLLWGENDTIVPLSVGERMHTLIKRSTLTTYPGFDHNYPITQPDFTHEEILRVRRLFPEG